MSFITKTLSFSLFGSLHRSQASLMYIPVRDYAARKGTREKARKKKVKVEEVKVAFVPHNQRNLEKMLAMRKSRKFDDSWKQTSSDDVYPMKYYKWKVYPFEEAVKCHRETHHPTMYNEPNAPLSIIIELNMQGEKKTRFVDNFTRVASIPHPFDHGEERNVLVFTKEDELQEAARDAGATLVGGIELAKEIHSGSLSLQDLQYVIAHPNILPELVSLRGLMRKRFPNPRNNTLTADLVTAIRQYVHGINYRAVKDEHEKDFGIIETSVGPLSMDARHLEENFKALIRDVNEGKPKRSGGFIQRVILKSPPCTERFKINHDLYLEKNNEEDDEEDEEEQRSTG